MCFVAFAVFAGLPEGKTVCGRARPCISMTLLTQDKPFAVCCMCFAAFAGFPEGRNARGDVFCCFCMCFAAFAVFAGVPEGRTAHGDAHPWISLFLHPQA